MSGMLVVRKWRVGGGRVLEVVYMFCVVVVPFWDVMVV
jgi:hypothetical protein